MNRQPEDVELDADVKETLCQQVFEATSYFEVLVTHIAFYRDAKPGGWMLLMGLSCELGEKGCVIPFEPIAQGLSETPDLRPAACRIQFVPSFCGILP